MKAACSRVAGLVLLPIGIVLAVAGLGFIPLTFILPESYSSTARIEVDREDKDASPPTPRSDVGHGRDFIQTEFEVIQSAKILHTVISNLNLNVAWAKKFGAEGMLRMDETFMLLRRQIAVRPVRNTSLIEIRVYSDTPDEAAAIANSIAEVYQDCRLEQRTKMSEGGIVPLKAQYQAQEKKVKDIQDDVDKLRKELDISDVEAAGPGPSPLLLAETLRRYQSLRTETESGNGGPEERLNLLKPLSREELRNQLPTAFPDILLNTLLEQASMAERALVRLNKTYGPENNEVVQTKAHIEDVNKKIDTRIQGILDGLELRVNSARKELAKLEEEVSKAPKQSIEKAEKVRPYLEKKRDLATARHFLEVLSMKIASEQTDAALPKTTGVDIVDRAVPGLRPVRPNKPLNIACGAVLLVVGVLTGIGGSLLIGSARQAQTITPAPPRA